MKESQERNEKEKRPLAISEWIFIVFTAIALLFFIGLIAYDAGRYAEYQEWKHSKTIRWNDGEEALVIFKNEKTGEYSMVFKNEEAWRESMEGENDENKEAD